MYTSQVNNPAHKNQFDLCLLRHIILQVIWVSRQYQFVICFIVMFVCSDSMQNFEEIHKHYHTQITLYFSCSVPVIAHSK
jgi:hypothetical protein